MGANSGTEGASSGFDSIATDFTKSEVAWQRNFTWDGDQQLPDDTSASTAAPP